MSQTSIPVRVSGNTVSAKDYKQLLDAASGYRLTRHMEDSPFNVLKGLLESMSESDRYPSLVGRAQVGLTLLNELRSGITDTRLEQLRSLIRDLRNQVDAAILAEAEAAEQLALQQAEQQLKKRQQAQKGDWREQLKTISEEIGKEEDVPAFQVDQKFTDLATKMQRGRKNMALLKDEDPIGFVHGALISDRHYVSRVGQQILNESGYTFRIVQGHLVIENAEFLALRLPQSDKHVTELKAALLPLVRNPLVIDRMLESLTKCGTCNWLSYCKKQYGSEYVNENTDHCAEFQVTPETLHKWLPTRHGWLALRGYLPWASDLMPSGMAVRRHNHLYYLLLPERALGFREDASIRVTRWEFHK